MKKFLLFLIALVATPALATPVITVPQPITVAENVGRITFTLTKDAAATDYSEVWVSTSDVGQTAKAGVDFIATSHDIDFDNNDTTRTFTIRIVNRTGTQGTRSFVIHFKSQRYATLTATDVAVTITDVATTPTAHPCYDFAGTVPLGAVPGSNCPARMCPGDPNPVDWSQPCPTNGTAMLMRQGLVYRVIGGVTPDPFISTPGVFIVPVVYDHDTTGQYLVPVGVNTELQFLFVGGTPLADPLVSAVPA